MEKTTMQRSNANLKTIYFGEDGGKDYIVISPDDYTMFDNFANGYRQIMILAEETGNKVREIQEPTDQEDVKSGVDYAVSVSRENVNFSNAAVKIVDGIFGKDTLKKYFSDVYKELPDFVPSADLILDFFDNIVPIIEETFSQTIEERDKERRKKMAKYQPQDHKRKAK